MNIAWLELTFCRNSVNSAFSFLLYYPERKGVIGVNFQIVNQFQKSLSKWKDLTIYWFYTDFRVVESIPLGCFSAKMRQFCGLLYYVYSVLEKGYFFSYFATFFKVNYFAINFFAKRVALVTFLSPELTFSRKYVNSALSFWSIAQNENAESAENFRFWISFKHFFQIEKCSSILILEL